MQTWSIQLLFMRVRPYQYSAATHLKPLNTLQKLLDQDSTCIKTMYRPSPMRLFSGKQITLIFFHIYV